jgi:NADH pyrophosphatase NudC (nudix superfamily)
MKEKEQAAADAKKMKEEKKLEQERKARGRQEEKERKKLEREERQKEKEWKAKGKSKKAKKQRRATKRAPSPVDTVGLESLFAKLDVEDNGQCSSCAMVFSQEDEDRFWVCCDRCDKWYCSACHKLLTKNSVPDEFYCMKCT